jgi:hypothetical protein
VWCLYVQSHISFSFRLSFLDAHKACVIVLWHMVIVSGKMIVTFFRLRETVFWQHCMISVSGCPVAPLSLINFSHARELQKLA